MGTAQDPSKGLQGKDRTDGGQGSRMHKGKVVQSTTGDNAVQIAEELFYVT